MPCCEAVSLPLRGLKSCLGGIVHPGAGLRTGSSKKSFIPSVRTGRCRIRDPVLPPLPQRCPPRGHRARGRRSFGMDAGGRVQRTKAVHPVPSPRSFSGAFCGRIRALHGLPHALWPSIPNSRNAENGPGVFVAPVGFAVNAFERPLLSPLSLSHCSPCAPRCRCALLPVRGGRRECACGCSVSRQPCWQGWQRIPGWWQEGLAFLPAEQGLSEIAV